MNQALQQQLSDIQQFDATHHRPIRILNEDDAAYASARIGKKKKGKTKPFASASDPFRRGLSFKYWNHYKWQLDITEFINKASPGYLAHLAGVSRDFEEPLRERWELWCKEEANYIPQAIRMNFIDYWDAWVDAGELNRFKDSIYAHRGGLTRTRYADVMCQSATCVFPDLKFQVRYTLVHNDAGSPVAVIATIDDDADPAGQAAVIHGDTATIRRKCPWCSALSLYEVEVMNSECNIIGS